MVLALFLSWSENFAWVRFLRYMKPIPIHFASLVRKQVGFEDSLHGNRFVEFILAGCVACD
jgi:L-arabinose isomerase